MDRINNIDGRGRYDYNIGINNNPQSMNGFNRAKYFQTMNKELNEKIEAIHAKYEKQRQQLLGKRMNTTDMSQTNTTDRKNRNQTFTSLKQKEKVEAINRRGKYDSNDKYDRYEQNYMENDRNRKNDKFHETDLSKYMLALRQTDVDYGRMGKNYDQRDRYRIGPYQPLNRRNVGAYF